MFSTPNWKSFLIEILPPSREYYPLQVNVPSKSILFEPYVGMIAEILLSLPTKSGRGPDGHIADGDYWGWKLFHAESKNLSYRDFLPVDKINSIYIIKTVHRKYGNGFFVC